MRVSQKREELYQREAENNVGSLLYEVEVPAGSFMMGALPDDKDVLRRKSRHHVEVERGCTPKYVYKYVRMVMEVNPSIFEGRKPVEGLLV